MREAIRYQNKVDRGLFHEKIFLFFSQTQPHHFRLLLIRLRRIQLPRVKDQPRAVRGKSGIAPKKKLQKSWMLQYASKQKALSYQIKSYNYYSLFD